MIWEVDEDSDGAVSMEEFMLMFERGRNDRTGHEPKKLFNLCQFMCSEFPRSDPSPASEARAKGCETGDETGFEARGAQVHLLSLVARQEQLEHCLARPRIMHALARVLYTTVEGGGARGEVVGNGVHGGRLRGVNQQQSSRRRGWVDGWVRDVDSDESFGA